MEKNIVSKIDSLINAINVLLLKNRLVYSEDDVTLLCKCIQELEELKDAIDLQEREELIFIKFVAIVKTLDIFFGLGDYLAQLFDVN